MLLFYLGTNLNLRRYCFFFFFDILALDLALVSTVRCLDLISISIRSSLDNVVVSAGAFLTGTH